MVLGCSSTKEHTDESVATPTPTPEPPKPPTEITIHYAVAQQEFVTIRATGQDLDFVNLTVTAKEHGFDFTIPGRHFANQRKPRQSKHDGGAHCSFVFHRSISTAAAGNEARSVLRESFQARTHQQQHVFSWVVPAAE